MGPNCNDGTISWIKGSELFKNPRHKVVEEQNVQVFKALAALLEDLSQLPEPGLTIHIFL